MILHPNCKINLGLCVTERRPDGYHNLQTVFLPVPLHDELTIEPATEDMFTQEGNALDCDMNDNLVVRVLNLLRSEGYQIPPVSVHLNKMVPSGAGLGGGSSDAAFMMTGLNELFRLDISQERMEQLISPLGADCAVFIRNKAVYAEGIGNIFTPISLDLSGWHLVLVKPDEFISTGEAYRGVKPGKPEHDLLQTIAEPVSTWKGRMVNDFEKSVFPNHPVVADICSRLYDLGADYAAMSGSGSTLYGLFSKEVENLQDLFPDSFTFQTTL